MHNRTAPSSCATVTWLVCSTTLGAIIPRWSIFDWIKLKLTESIIKKVAVNKHRTWKQVGVKPINQHRFALHSSPSTLRRDTNGLNDQINQSFLSPSLSFSPSRSLLHVRWESGKGISVQPALVVHGNKFIFKYRINGGESKMNKKKLLPSFFKCSQMDLDVWAIEDFVTIYTMKLSSRERKTRTFSRCLSSILRNAL